MGSGKCMKPGNTNLLRYRLFSRRFLLVPFQSISALDVGAVTALVSFSILRSEINGQSPAISSFSIYFSFGNEVTIFSGHASQ